jgi:hypothetical protein
MPATTTIPTILEKSIPLADQPSWDIFNTIIQSQNNIAMMGIMSVIGLATLLLAASFAAYYILVNRRINDAIRELRAEIESNKQKYKIFTEELRDENKKIIEKTIENIGKQFKIAESEMARLYALVSEQAGSYSASVNWWCDAITGYVQIKIDLLTRISIKQLIRILNKCDQLSEENIMSLKKCIPLIPDILDEEKKEIEGKLKHFEQKKKSQPELGLEE